MTARRALLPLICIAFGSVAWGQIAITSMSPLPQGFSTLPYTYTFMAASSQPQSSIVWSVPTASLPNLPTGFSLSANGTFSGTSAQYGTFSFQVTATAAPFSDTRTFSLTLVNPEITISTPPNLGTAFVGQAYSLLFAGTSNVGALTWTLTSAGSQLPPGLTLTPAGLLSGTPTTPGVYSFVLNVQISGTIISSTPIFTLTVSSGQTTIQTTSLPFAVSGQPYSATMLGGPAGIAWTLNGPLPPGITFNQTTGVFSGSTVFTGIYPLQFQATYPNYLSATRALTLYVVSGPLTVQPNLPPAVQGSPYQATASASGGLPPYQWSFVNTSNIGLSITSTGAITGTPQTSGNFQLPVILSDATGESMTQNLILFVANGLSVATTSLPNGTVGTPYSQSLLPTGGQSPFTWIVVPGSGSLPPGLTLSSSGVISGTPASNGSFHFTVQVTDAGGRTATGALTISMGVAPLVITTSSLAAGQLTVAYSQALSASGGVSPYTWALASGVLPNGLALNNGIISGTPLGPLGTTTFTLQVTDSSPPPALTAQKAFTVNIALTLTITSLTLPGGIVGTPYSQTLAGSGGTSPYTWSVTSGTLPAGLQLNASNGVISGTPTATGPNLFTVTMTDAAGLSTQQQLNITIVAPLANTTATALSATSGVAFSQTLTATGGTAPYTWSIASGTLPAGLQLSNGVISGTPTAAGTSSVTLQVTDSQQNKATAVISITVSLPAPPPLTIGTIPGTPATQPSVTVTLSSPYAAALAGTLSVSFQSAVGGNPTEVTFFTSAGSFTSLPFNIAAGATTAVFPNKPVLATGTVAGTITLIATLTTAAGAPITPNPSPASETITIAPSAPVIQSVAFSNTAGSLSVVVTGYSTTREMVSGQFTFAPVTGSKLSQSAITVQLAAPFSTWYQSSAANPWGGQFMLTVPFSVAGDAADVSSVSVTLTNTKGTSPAVSPQ
jgi:hypothetical protein